MRIDVRGPRFAATITTVVLAVVLLTGSGWLALAQTVVFAASALRPRSAPYAMIFRWLVAPRLAPATEFEPPEPVRFAQLVGFGFGAVSSVGYLVGAPLLGAIAAGGALIAALLNAAFGLCLGCEAYLLLRRAFAPRPEVVRES